MESSYDPLGRSPVAYRSTSDSSYRRRRVTGSFSFLDSLVQICFGMLGPGASVGPHELLYCPSDNTVMRSTSHSEERGHSVRRLEMR